VKSTLPALINRVPSGSGVFSTIPSAYKRVVLPERSRRISTLNVNGMHTSAFPFALKVSFSLMWLYIRINVPLLLEKSISVPFMTASTLTGNVHTLVMTPLTVNESSDRTGGVAETVVAEELTALSASTISNKVLVYPAFCYIISITEPKIFSDGTP
jgi:hypothetical protein